MESKLNTLSARYRYSFILLQQLVKTDFKLRYQGSVLGYLWSLLRPLALFTIMYVVFLKFLRFNYGVPHSKVYLLLGLVLWNFFVEITSNGVSAIVGKGDLLRKINFPKYVVILAVSFSALINLAINAVVIAIFMFFDHVHVGPKILLVIPLVVELYVLALALAFFLSAMFVKLRDMSYIWEVILQALFYATPIFYPLIQVPLKYSKYMLLSPIAQNIQDLRHVVVTGQSQTVAMLWHTRAIRLIPFALVLIMAVVGVQFFRKHARNFAEEI